MSIHDFSKEHYEFLVKLYQFIEQSGKEPFIMVLDLYKLLGMIKEVADNNGRPAVNGSINKIGKEVDNFKGGNLRKYKGMIKHQILPIIEQNSRSSSLNYRNLEVYQRAFIDLMEAIFKSEGLNGLYDGVEQDADIAQRFRYNYNVNKYREILTLAEQLVEYNKLKCDKVVSRDQIDFDFKVESGKYEIDVQSQIISQKYQEFFKNYVQSISDHLESLIKSIIISLDIPKKIESSLSPHAAQASADISRLEAEKARLEQEITDFQIDEDYYIQEADDAAKRGDVSIQQDALADAGDARRERESRERRLYQLNTELDQLRVLDTIINKVPTDIKDSINGRINIDTNSSIFKKIKDGVISVLANDLTFIYDDGKRFFANELAAQGFINLSADGVSPNMLDGDGFQSIADGADTKYPEETEKNENGFIIKEPNPDYYAAQVAKSLKDGFDMMAEDTIIALGDYLAPIIRETIANIQSNVSSGVNPSVIALGSKNVNQQDLINKIFQEVVDIAVGSGITIKKTDKIYDNLRSVIYRNRFIDHILVHFKRMFKTRHIDKVIEFDQAISQLHPLIKKLLKNGRDCQYFKSFIIDFDTVMSLYNLKFMMDTKKFIYGLVNQPPKKYNNVMSKLQVVLFDFLGLKNNPVWIISKTEVFLSMPDDLSLTNTSVLSKIPKTELMDVCKIKPSDYWNEATLGKVTQVGNKKLTNLYKQLKDEEKKLSDAKKNKNKSKNKKKNDDNINRIQKKIDSIEEKIAKVKEEDKNVVPNAFLFNDDPNMAEKNELLNDTEREDLNRSKEEMKEKLLNLNPFDDDEVEKMSKAAESQIVKSHPFDFIDTNEAQDTKEEKREKDAETEKAFEEFLRQREQHSDRYRRD
jgi:vacuolar-type H+-ATPase subunit F/Vma7